MERLRCQDGMTLVEVLVAMLVLTVGILSMVSMFDSARKLTLAAERRESIAHLAQRELERLQSVPYDELAMVSKPAHESIPASDTTTEEQENFIHEHPDYYVDYSSPSTCTEVETGGCFAPNAEKLTEEEPLVITQKGVKCPTSGTTTEECGVVSSSPVGVECSEVNPFGACEWSDGRLKGDVYDFVTFHKDPACETECEESYKRVTVIVTVNVPTGSHAPAPVRVSTMIPNPAASAANPVTSGATKCINEAREEVSCTQALNKGTARTFFLHDVEAEAVESSSYEAIENEVESKSVEKGHPTTHTVGPAPAKPDFMDSTPATRTALYDYSNDQNGLGFTYGIDQYGGRRIAADVACNSETALTSNGSEPSKEAFKGEMWVSSRLGSNYKLTGDGGLTIFTQTLGEAPEPNVRLCLGVYDVPERIESLWSTPETTPKLIGFYEYVPTSAWPTKMSQLSFVFKLKFIKADQTVATGHRLGFRLWPTDDSAATTEEDISIAYDTMLQPSALQLNTEE